MIQTETPAGVDSYQDGTCDYAAIRERTDLTDSNPVPQPPRKVLAHAGAFLFVSVHFANATSPRSP